MYHLDWIDRHAERMPDKIALVDASQASVGGQIHTGGAAQGFRSKSSLAAQRTVLGSFPGALYATKRPGTGLGAFASKARSRAKLHRQTLCAIMGMAG